MIVIWLILYVIKHLFQCDLKKANYVSLRLLCAFLITVLSLAPFSQKCFLPSFYLIIFILMIIGAFLLLYQEKCLTGGSQSPESQFQYFYCSLYLFVFWDFFFWVDTVGWGSVKCPFEVSFVILKLLGLKLLMHLILFVYLDIIVGFSFGNYRYP